jgi:hypothetical protein
MAWAWTEGYWLTYSLIGDPRLSFEIPTYGAPTIWPWKLLPKHIRFEVVKAQLDTPWIAVQWNDATKEITQIVAWTGP